MKRFRLTMAFALTSVLVIAIAANVVYRVFGDIAMQRAIAVLQEDAVQDALMILSMSEQSYLKEHGPEVAKDASWRDDLGYLLEDSGLSFGFRSYQPTLGLVEGFLYDLTGGVLWSSDSGRYEVEEEERSLLAAAVGGEISSGIRRRHVAPAPEGGTRLIDTIETYVPVRAGSDNRVIGVLEIYKDVTDQLNLLVDETRSSVLRATVFTMGGLFAALLGFIVAADVTTYRRNRRALERERRFRSLLEQQNRELTESEGRFRTVVSRAPIAMLRTDGRGVITLAEGRGLEAIAATPRTVSGRSVFEVFKDYPDLAADFQHALGGESRTATEELGATSWHVSIEPLTGNGARGGVVAVAYDVTELSLAQARLRRETEERTVLAEISRVISSSPDIADVYSEFARQVGKLLRFDRLAVSAIDPARRNFTYSFQVGTGQEETLASPSRPLEGTATGLMLATRSSLLVNFRSEEELARAHPELDPQLARGFRSLLSVPLIHRGEVIGGLHLRSATYGEYGPAELALAEQIATQITGAIAIARLQADLRVAAAAVEASMDAVVVSNARGEIIRVNPATERIFGYPAATLIGKPYAMLAPEEDREAYAADLAAIQAGRKPRFAGRTTMAMGCRAGGARFPVELSVASIDGAGEAAYVATARDITARVRAQRERGLRERLDAENRELQRVNEARSQFLSVVSHELKTPLTSILAFADILARNREGNLTPRQLRHIDVMRRGGRRLNELIDDLLDVSRIDSGRLTLKRSVFDVRTLFDEAVAGCAGLLQKKQQSLQTDLPESRVRINADRRRMLQVLNNLLSNASKYSPEGSAIRLAARTRGDALAVEVQDHGIGISPEDQKHLFTPFFRAENEAVRSVSGTGLGLVIVKSIVELHGGAVGLESAPGEGTTVCLELPGAVEAPGPQAG